MVFFVGDYFSAEHEIKKVLVLISHSNNGCLKLIGRVSVSIILLLFNFAPRIECDSRTQEKNKERMKCLSKLLFCIG